MADAGADPFTLAAILGHSDIRMTARYTHATDEAKRRAVENWSRLRALHAGETPAVPVNALPMKSMVNAVGSAKFGNDLASDTHVTTASQGGLCIQEALAARLTESVS